MINGPFRWKYPFLVDPSRADPHRAILNSIRDPAVTLHLAITKPTACGCTMSSRGGSRSRASSRLARRNKNGDKAGEDINTSIVSLGQNGQPLDEIDMMFDRYRSKFFPICAPINKKVNTHNLAEIPSIQSLQSDEDSVENGSQNSESTDSFRKNYAKRKNANSLIESRNKFRQLLNQIQMKSKPMTNGATKCDSLFDGYDLKSRKVKYEPRRTRREMAENNMNNRHVFVGEYFVKLCDKTIDLTPYCKRPDANKYISLYPICRLWARSNYGIPEYLRSKRNVPPPPMKDETIDPDGPYSDTPVDVHHMPKPEPLPLDEDGNAINIRIPKFVREFQRPKSTIADHLNSMEHLTQEETLALSLPHWKYVKKEFLGAARENEKRYKHSFDLLKSMFEKANNGDSVVAYYKNPPYESDVSESPSKAGTKPIAPVKE